MVNLRRPRSNPQDNTLVVWTNGERVGLLSVTGGEYRFQYDNNWQLSPAGRQLSLSLPFTPGNLQLRGNVVRDFFDNLLPDNAAIRRRMRDKFATSGIDTFELLAAVGRDCVGAVQLLPAGVEPAGYDRIDAVPLDEAGVEHAINTAVTQARVLGQLEDDDLRLSIAGAQEKTALLWHHGQWCRPLGATPTTHIFKLPMGLVGNMSADMSTSVENEWLCAKIVAALGLPVAQCEIAMFGKRKVLVVERFDRALQTPDNAQAWWARLPQEDFCQALGVSGRYKYESEGGPGIKAILRQLDNSKAPESDKTLFMNAQLAFWLMAATDGHAKNFSIFLERGGGYRMTPLYDVQSAWPIIGNGANQLTYRRAKLAMDMRSKNTHYHLHEIQTRHWQGLATQSGVQGAFDQMVGLVLRVPLMLENVEAQLPAGFPQKVFKPIRDGMLAQANRFVDGL
jgi:serine/threonine-protein kinase HipA